MYIRSLLAGAAVTLLSVSALAQIKVGVTLSITGPAASLGQVEKNVFDLLPRTMGGQAVEYIILDDASDPTTAVKNARKLVGENKVDILMGSTTTPNCLAISVVAAETKTPLIAMGSGISIVEPMDEVRKWVFKPVHNDSMMIGAVVEHMVKHGVKTVGYIGLADATGEGYLKALKPMAEKAGIKFVATELYNRTDQSVSGQVLRLIAAKPEAIFIASLGTPAATPQIELMNRGFKGKIYHTHGIANQDFLRVAGPSAEGLYLPIGPLLIAPQLPDSNPVKKISMDMIARYEAKFGAGTVNTFISNAYDSVLLMENALPTALKAAKPGTPEFRAALRDALEGTKNFVGTQGVYNMTPTDHVGLDDRSRAIIRVVKGKWTLAD